MGMKSLRYEDGKTRNEQKFNYSTELEAQQIHDWFEKITETELYLINLDKCVRFDHSECISFVAARRSGTESALLRRNNS